MENENENLFRLLDISGSEEIFDFCPKANVLCYSTGCLIVYLDLNRDKKFFVKYHTGLIKSLKFNKLGDFLISLDEIGKIVIWQIPSLIIVSQFYTPITYDNSNVNYPNFNSIQEIFIEFFSENKFCVIFNFINKKCFFYLFEINSTINSQMINLLFEYKINFDSFSECYDMKTFYCGKTSKQEVKLVTIEEMGLKLWNINEAELKIDLITNVKMKQKLVKNTLQISESFKLISFLNIDGSIIVLDLDGNFVICLSPVSQDKEDRFVSSYIYEESLLLGSLFGNLFIYDKNGFKLKGIIKYENNDTNEYGYIIKNLNNKMRFSNSSINTICNLDSSYNKGLFKYNINYNKKDHPNHNPFSNDFNQITHLKSPALVKIFINIVNESEDILIRKFSDNSIIITNFKKLLTNQRLILTSSSSLRNTSLNLGTSHSSYNIHFYFNYSHFKRVNDIVWLNEDKKNFLTCGEDEILMNWQIQGEKWISNHFDLLKLFDKNFYDFLKNRDQTIYKNMNCNYLSLQILKINPTNPNILVAGDNKGYLHIFNLEDLLINMDNNKSNNFNHFKSVTNSYKRYQVGNFLINNLDFSKSGNFLTVGFETGQVILIDLENDCRICIILEEHFNDSRNLNLRKIENKFLSFGYIFKIRNYNIFNDEYVNKTPKNASSKFYLKSINNCENNLRIVTLHDMHTFRIYNITRDKTKFLQSVSKEIKIRNKIKKAEIHSSEDYIIVLTQTDSIEIYRVETNQIVGEIHIDKIVSDFDIDPSGLYLAILVDDIQRGINSTKLRPIASITPIALMTDPALKPSKQLKRSSLSDIDAADCSNILDERNMRESDKNLNGKESFNYFNTNNFNNLNFANMKNSNKSTIDLYEIGTGRFVTSLSNIFEISKFKFSNDGNFLTIASESGCVSIWNLPRNILENIMAVRKEVKNRGKSEFWDEFRINYFIEKENDIKPNLIEKHANNFKKNFGNSNLNSNNNFQELKEKYCSKFSTNQIDNYISNFNDYQEDIITTNIISNSINSKLNNKNDEYVSINYDSNNNLNEYKQIGFTNPYKKFKETNETKKFTMNQGRFGKEMAYHLETEISDKKEFKKKFPSSSNQDNFTKIYNQNKSSQTQTSFVNREAIDEFQKNREKEWKSFHKYERMGLLNEDYRIINKDPSIYSAKIPSVVKRNNQTNKFSITQINFPVPNLTQAKVEDLSRINFDIVRSVNIENAIKEYENSAKNNNNNNNKSQNLIKKPSTIKNQSENLGDSCSVNFNKENNIRMTKDKDLRIANENVNYLDPKKNCENSIPEATNGKNILEDKSRFETKNNSNLFDIQDNIQNQPEKSITDQTYYLNNKIGEFVRMHNLK